MKVRDLPISGRPVVLCWSKRIWRCGDSDCEKATWTETTEAVQPRASLSERARAEMCRRVGDDGDSVAEVARAFGVGWHTAMDAVRSHGQPVDQTDRTTANGIHFDNSPLGVMRGGSTFYTRDPNGTFLSMTDSANTYYYLYDGQGNVIGLSNGSGILVGNYTYDPYGITTATNDGGTTAGTANPFRYHAGHQDPTGLYHYVARYYDPNSGTWTQKTAKPALRISTGFDGRQ